MVWPLFKSLFIGLSSLDPWIVWCAWLWQETVLWAAMMNIFSSRNETWRFNYWIVEQISLDWIWLGIGPVVACSNGQVGRESVLRRRPTGSRRLIFWQWSKWSQGHIHKFFGTADSTAVWDYPINWIRNVAADYRRAQCWLVRQREGFLASVATLYQRQRLIDGSSRPPAADWRPNHRVRARLRNSLAPPPPSRSMSSTAHGPLIRYHSNAARPILRVTSQVLHWIRRLFDGIALTPLLCLYPSEVLAKNRPGRHDSRQPSVCNKSVPSSRTPKTIISSTGWSKSIWTARENHNLKLSGGCRGR